MKRKLLFALSLFLFLSACTTAKISFNKENIIITDGSNQQKVLGTYLLYKDYLKLSNMKIEYRVVKFDDGAIAVLEELNPNSRYIFDGAITKTISIGFDNYSYEKVNSKGDMSFFILRDKIDNTQLLYLSLYNRNKKHIKLIYTANKRLFDSILESFETRKDKKTVSENNTTNLIEQDAKGYIRTNWSEKSLILAGLLKQQPSIPKIVH